MKLPVEEIIVVEGKNDTNILKKYLVCDTIETNGSAVADHVISQVRLAVERRGVIIFTDPDYPGEKIRRTIEEKVPGCKHAFLQKEDAIDHQKNKVGVEHASGEDIIRAINEAKPSYGLEYQEEKEITKEDLFAAGLIGGRGSREKRDALGKELNIGYTNGKQLLKRLHQFRINRNEYTAALKRVERGDY
jgi:ribonuclease M5